MTPSKIQKTIDTLKPLADIWKAYLDNDLDDEARRFWGPDDNRTENTQSPNEIELYTGRGGKRLLTLDQCREAAATMHMLKSNLGDAEIRRQKNWL